MLTARRSRLPADRSMFSESLNAKASGVPQRSQKARRAILDVALELFATQGYDATSVREVVESAATAYAGGLPGRFDLVHLGLGDDGHTSSGHCRSTVALSTHGSCSTARPTRPSVESHAPPAAPRAEAQSSCPSAISPIDRSPDNTCWPPYQSTATRPSVGRKSTWETIASVARGRGKSLGFE